MIVTIDYESDHPIIGCSSAELLVGDKVQLAIEQVNELWPSKVVGAVSSVCYNQEYGRKYSFEFDDSQLNGGPELKSCLITPSAYCCCDELRDAIFSDEVDCGNLNS